MSIQIQPIPAFNDNYIWLIVDTMTKKALCVDPGEAEPVMLYLRNNGLKLTSIFITHHHFDHIGGLKQLKAKYPNVSIWGPEDPRISSAFKPVTDNDTITVAPFANDFKVITTPGHTSSHICYYSNTLNALFCGDTLFSGGCGRLFEGTAEQMLNSLRKLCSLPEQTQAYPAHEYTEQNLRFALTLEPNNKNLKDYLNWVTQQTCTLPTTLELEKQVNPFLRCDHYQVNPPQCLKHTSTSSESSIFAQVRHLKDQF